MAQKMKAGEAVIEILRQEGVSHIFGIVGSSFLDILDPLYDRTDVEFIGVRHEQGAALMADGFGRISGKPGVVLVTNGPGVLNLTFGVGSAYVAHSPMIILAPSASREHQYRDSTQEFDQVALFKPITKACFPVNKIERLPDALRHAFRVATSGKMGPVMVDIPRDLLPGGEVDLEMLPPDTYRSGQTRSRGDRNLIDKAASVLLSAQRPVIVAGGGVQWSNAADEVTRMADLIGAAITTSYGRADAVPNDHPMYLGHLGRLGSEEGIEAVKQADVILAVGTRLVTSQWIDGQKVIQIDVDPEEIGRHYENTLRVEGDARLTMEDLLTALSSKTQAKADRTAEVAAQKTQRSEDIIKVEPQGELLEAVRRALPEDSILISGMTQLGYYSRAHYPVYEPRTFITSSYSGNLGYAYPTALGAKVAQPDKAVVCLSGDGGFMFNSQEMSTAVAHNINVVVVVFNDNAYGNVKRDQMNQFNGRTIGADLHNPDFVKLAEAYGARGFLANGPAELEATLKKALTLDAPVLIEVPVGPMPSPFFKAP